ncbi:ABC transporter permease [Salipiger bermudensis]|uniref:Peptide ABC transporter, permease protein n=1 Tax=Salipiger bermudensis (strain DSM 26914 / JCM 13377 / KCTC 12554 / HTCC2601) TaxID=314265 RepID=Q0FSN8_SALBH|nr:ABC transporter permease [Salipiger bermudensis]EAU47215.1 peptide ABC transporter, permease protein [Salipiger bermudensis HTCC2601]
MGKFILQRLFAALVTIWIATIAVTILIHLVPGDPVRIMYGSFQTTPEELEAIRVRLGLDQPIWTQYLMYLERLVQGDLGRSIVGDQPVLDVLLTRFPATLALTVSSLAIAIVVGMSLGFLAAYKRGTWVDVGAMVLAIVGVSMPHFWLGLLLLFLFALQLQWLPVAGGDWRSLLLPALTLGLANAAVLARLTRSAMIDIFDQDFIRTARAKGLPRSIVLYRHALRSGLVPVVSMLGLQFAYLMGGAIVIENVFAWNGVGRLAIEAVLSRDYPLIQGFILFFATVVALASVVIDIAYAFLDPRIRYS